MIAHLVDSLVQCSNALALVDLDGSVLSDPRRTVRALVPEAHQGAFALYPLRKIGCFAQTAGCSETDPRSEAGIEGEFCRMGLKSSRGSWTSCGRWECVHPVPIARGLATTSRPDGHHTAGDDCGLCGE